ncbi:MAG: MFS transporter [Alicyclobacillus sp.]|nr:MFS transporter [Alicyclobacillus sp.]
MQLSPNVRRPVSSAAAIPTSVRWTHIGLTLLVAWTIGMIDKSSLSIVMANKDFLKETGLAGHTVELGMLTTAMLIAYAIGQPIWGHVLTRWGARRCLTLGLFIWVVALLAFAASSSYGAMLFWRIVLGLGEAVLFPVCSLYVYYWYPEQERARASSVWYSGTMIGPALSGFSLAWIVGRGGWRVCFIVFAVLTLVVTIPMVIWLTRETPQQHPRVNEAERRWILEASGTMPTWSAHQAEPANYQFLKDVRFWLLTVSHIGNSVFFWGWSTWIPSYLRSTEGFSLQQVGWLTTLMYGCCLITIFAGSVLSDKDKKLRRAPYGVMGFTLAGCFALLQVAKLPAGLALVMLISTLAFQQVGASIFYPMLQRIVNNASVGRAQGVSSFFAQGGAALSPVVIGSILGKSGGFTSAFVVMAVALLVAAGTIAFLIRREDLVAS